MPVTIPANDRKASNLYFLSSFLGLISSSIDHKPILEAGSQAIAMAVLTLLLMAALMLGIGLGIRKGYRLAKIIFLLLFANAIFSFASAFSYLMSFRGLLGVVANIVDLCAAIIIVRDLLRRPVAGEVSSSSAKVH